MARRGRGGQGGRGCRRVTQGSPNRAPLPCIQSHHGETDVQLTTPTSRHPISSEASCSISRNVRGSFKCISIDSKTKNGQKIQIVIPDDILRAVGEGSRDLVNYIGHIVRGTCPLKERNWTKIWEQCGEQILLQVKEKFEVGASMQWRFDAFINATAQRLYKNWRSRLHLLYSKYNTDEERLAHPPPTVNDDEWKHLISYFGSDDFKGKSSINAQNRAKQTTKHMYGSRSFAEVEESTRNLETGEKAPLNQIWELQHTRKTKEGEVIWSDAKSKEVHVQLQEIIAKQSQEDTPGLSNEQMLTQVLGQRTGYFRGKGYGAKPPTKRAAPQITSQHLEEQDKKIRENIVIELREEMRLREERMQAQFEERLQSQMSSLITSLQLGQIPLRLMGSVAPSSTNNTIPTPIEPPS